MIIQLGNRDNRPDDDLASRVLKDFCNFLIENYPNIVPIGIYLHNDEFSIDEETHLKVISSPHIHFDYIYLARRGKSLKTGMELQCSMSGALAEMGFVTAKGKGTAQQQFEESVRHALQDFAEERGIKIDRTPGEKHSHKEKPVFQQMKENEKKEHELAEREKVVELGEAPLLKKQKELDQQKNEIDQKAKNAEQALKDAQTIQAENEKTSKNLELEQNDLERDKSLFKTSTQKVGTYNQICD